MKNVCLPKINILLQFGNEISALSCSSDSIQILVRFCLAGFLVLNRLEPRQNYKDLYRVTGARKGQYIIPRMQYDVDFWQIDIHHNITPSQSFALRYASRHSLRNSLVPYGTFVVEGSSCMRAKKRFATSVSFVVSLPVYSSFTRGHSIVRSITVSDSPSPDSLVSIIL